MDTMLPDPTCAPSKVGVRVSGLPEEAWIIQACMEGRVPIETMSAMMLEIAALSAQTIS
jgi:hypothetical protein